MAQLFSQYRSGLQFTAGTIAGSANGVSGLNPIVDRLNSISPDDNVLSGTDLTIYNMYGIKRFLPVNTSWITSPTIVGSGLFISTATLSDFLVTYTTTIQASDVQTYLEGRLVLSGTYGGGTITENGGLCRIYSASGTSGGYGKHIPFSTHYIFSGFAAGSWTAQWKVTSTDAGSSYFGASTQVLTVLAIPSGLRNIFGTTT